MNRFQRNYSSILQTLLHLILPILLIATLIFLVIAVNMIDSRASKEEIDNLDRAVTQCITTCYALEGAYPPNLDYLKVNYGLTYNETRFYIDYRPIASNLRPDFTIIPK